MQQRIEISVGQNRPTIADDCSDITLAITEENAYAHLDLPPSVSRIQITGKESMAGLRLAGRGQTVAVVTSNPRLIRELQVDGLVIEVDQLAVGTLQFSGGVHGLQTFGVCFTEAPDTLSIPYVVASEQIIVGRHSSSKYMGIFIDRDNSGSQVSATVQVDDDFGERVAHLGIGQLRAPSLMVATGVHLTLKEWMYGIDEDPIRLVMSKCAVVRLGEKASIGPLAIDAAEGTLELASAIAERVSGVLGCLSTSGPCVFRGEGLRLSRLRCGADGDISGVSVYALDLASLSYAAQASAFDVVLPEDQSWRSLYGSTASSTWWRESAAWRTLYEQLERKGRPVTAAWARRMEREARRKLADRRSVQYIVLETAHLLGYGESVLRPLFAQAVIAVLGWIIVIIVRDYPAKYRGGDIALLLPRLYLAPLGVLRSGAFTPNLGTSIIAYVLWPSVALSGIVCFATTALAVRRMLAYL